MEATPEHEDLVMALKPICKRYFQFKGANIEELFDKYDITNSESLSKKDRPSLLLFGQELINEFNQSRQLKPSRYDEEHYQLYFLPLQNVINNPISCENGE